MWQNVRIIGEWCIGRDVEGEGVGIISDNISGFV
jgi:hypothetical protein